MTDLDRLLNMIYWECEPDDIHELKSLIAKLEQQLEDGKLMQKHFSKFDMREEGKFLMYVKNLESQITTLTNENKELKKLFTTKKSNIGEYQKVIDGLKFQIQQLTNEKKQLEEEVKERDDEFNKACNGYFKTKKQLKQLISRIEKSGRRLSLADSSHSVSEYFVIDEQILQKYKSGEKK